MPINKIPKIDDRFYLILLGLENDLNRGVDSYTYHASLDDQIIPLEDQIMGKYND